MAMAMATGECQGWGDAGPVALALQLPALPLLVSRLRNGREAQLLLDLHSIAAHFDCLFRSFVPLAHASQHLQHAWDQLWLAQDPTVVKAIPLIAHEMSRLNWARARLMHLMDCQLRLLHSRADTLRHFVEVNSTLAQELRMEGVERLAADKELLVEMERCIELRVRRVLEGDLSASSELQNVPAIEPLKLAGLKCNMDARFLFRNERCKIVGEGTTLRLFLFDGGQQAPALALK